MSKRIEKLLISTYRDKGTTFSASQLTKNDYQLWVEYNAPKEERETLTSFKSYLGSALHLSFEQQEFPGVVQEFTWTKNFNGVSIGGTCDRLDYIEDRNIWQLGDYKLKGDYSYRKFVEGDTEKEVLQLSIYRWLFKGLFNIADDAIIFLFMSGHTKRSKYPEYQEFDITLLEDDVIERYIKDKIDIVTSPEIPTMDCDTNWQCDYCNVCNSCPYLKEKRGGFSDES